MGVPGLAKRLLYGVLHRQTLGRIDVRFYPPSSQASITVSPSLDTLSRRDWHWLYLQHLAEALGTIGEEPEAVRLLVAARALAEDFVSSSYWPHMIGEKIPDAIAGAAQIIPERPGGTALTVEVVRRGGAAPAVRLRWSTPEARERVASSNLVLLVHVMRAAAHPLEQYELFKKIALFAEYCERAGTCHDWASLRTGPLYAVVHADIAGVPIPPASRRTSIAPLWMIRKDAREGGSRRAARPASPPGVATPPPASSRAPQATRRPWDRPGVAICAAALLWAGLVLGAFVVTPNDGSSLLRPPRAVIPAAVHTVPAAPFADRAVVPPPAPSSGRHLPTSARAPEALRPASRTPARSGDVERPWGSEAPPEAEPGGAPRFRVVSGTLARDVAALRSKILSEQGVDSFVRAMTGNRAQLQYGAYRSREIAEEDARRIRAQGYSAVVVRW